MDKLNLSSSVFDVFLRLRPQNGSELERFMEVDETSTEQLTHITVRPPVHDVRKPRVERFAFTRVFDEDSSQLDVFEGSGIRPMLEGILGCDGKPGRDGLVATLGVTGSGKSHTILGTRTQRGLTQMTLDTLFQSIGDQLVSPTINLPQLASADVSEAKLVSAADFLESLYSEGDSRFTSRAGTPMVDCGSNWTVFPSSNQRRNMPRISTIPPSPEVDQVDTDVDPDADYAIIVSMYEVYNDKVFDLLTGTVTNSKQPHKDAAKRRPLLFKSTEFSQERKVVAGLTKVACGTFQEALLVLEAGLLERRVAGTGSNAVSSRSHGFFCVEVKKRKRHGLHRNWTGSTMTIADLAGSERARAAKTVGSTLAEAGKINESLMYLGQCMQMQSDNAAAAGNNSSAKPSIVPIRHCKLTEILFSNTFQSNGSIPTPAAATRARAAQAAQKAIMIVTADPRGDFNATSQILRYSALAREVTVPRIPSITSVISAGTSTTAINTSSSRPGTAGSNHASWQSDSEEIGRLMSEVALLKLQLEDETRKREEVEMLWVSAEERCDEIELEARQECWNEFEQRLQIERNRWIGVLEEEKEVRQEHEDQKIARLAEGLALADGGVKIREDGLAERYDELERENEALRQKVQSLERERMSSRTPSRKLKVLKAPRWNVMEDDQENMTP